MGIFEMTHTKFQLPVEVRPEFVWVLRIRRQSVNVQQFSFDSQNDKVVGVKGLLQAGDKSFKLLGGSKYGHCQV